MTAALRPGTRAARHAARLESTASRLADVALPGSPAWLARARRAAMARLHATGLPDKRDEYWRYTDPARLLDAVVTPEAPRTCPDFTKAARVTLVFVDGEFDAARSDDPAQAGVEIARLAQTGDIHWAQEVYGVLEARAQTPVARPLATLNSATATDGVLIRVTGQAERPVSLVYERRAPQGRAVLHHVIRLAPGAQFTLLESGSVAAQSNVVIEAEIGDGATLHHVRVQGRDADRLGAAHLFATLGAGSALKSFTLTANGALQRNEAQVWLTGKGGSAHLAGAAMGDGAFHHDDTVFITHAAPACESRQVFKKVLRHGAVGVFQGKILVEQPAQLTDGYQISQSLLLDEDCQFLAKPELEIYADDVKCSHGSTSGEIDDAQLFYLRARGVPEETAKSLLVLAFLAEALDEIADETLQDDIRDRLEGWLSRHTG
jgi:Fe-S cluster assembly protein SufD